MTVRRHLSRPWIRAAIGVGISATFVAVILRTIDLELMGDAWGTVEFGMVPLAALISFVEVGVRAARWRLLLRSLAPVGYTTVLGYLAIGHLANAILPARLGDVARGLLTGVRLRVARVSVLGTIAVERVSDAGLLGLAVTFGVLVGFRQFASTMAMLAGAGAATVAVGVVVFVILRRESVAGTRPGAFIRHHGSRFWVGATGFRHRRDPALWATLTVVSFGLTVLIFFMVATAVGLTIPIWQAALIIAAVTLSLAIPAGPASIGTYEFVGVTVMASMGFAPEQSLLCVALVHAVVVVPPSSLGLAAVWWLGVRTHAPLLLNAGHEPASERVG